MFDVILNEEEVASGSVGDVSMEENDNNDSDATDVIFETPSGSFPLPMPCTLDGLVKQENDIISGNLPFRTWVSLRQIQYFLFVICSFIYSIIIYRKTEDAHINVMANWWSCPNQQSKSSFIGIRMIRNLKTSNTINVLLVRCVRSANLKKADVSEAGRAFIRGSTINILLSSI